MANEERVERVRRLAIAVGFAADDLCRYEENCMGADREEPCAGCRAWEAMSLWLAEEKKSAKRSETLASVRMARA